VRELLDDGGRSDAKNPSLTRAAIYIAPPPAPHRRAAHASHLSRL